MKKLFLAVLFLPLICQAKIGEQAAFRIYSKLIRENNLPSYHIYIKGEEINAYYDEQFISIIVTRSLLNTIQNEDELAIVLAHELAHAKYHDVKSILETTDWSIELRADQLGGQYAKTAGYDICRGMQWIKRYGEPDKDHPPGNYRANKMGCK